MAKVIKIN